mmetsp:Transcript_41747/g.102900  ORF Transcript_41747/g.102900 Transcript_41747/m.102900 type:complete len:149 (-) Transcript_41747:96-542(-)
MLATPAKQSRVQEEALQTPVKRRASPLGTSEAKRSRVEVEDDFQKLEWQHFGEVSKEGDRGFELSMVEKNCDDCHRFVAVDSECPACRPAEGQGEDYEEIAWNGDRGLGLSPLDKPCAECKRLVDCAEDDCPYCGGEVFEEDTTADSD